MLGLKLPTDPRWADIAEKNIEEILVDHAFCEHKAASTAMSLIANYPEKEELVAEMSDLVQEEMGHFKLVLKHLEKRNLKLGKELPDPYVKDLFKFFKKGVGREQYLINRLLIAALIEARSCERFRVLSEKLEDQELAEFYRKLMISEANHYTMFLGLARKYGNREEVDQLWQELLVYEAQVMKSYNKHKTIHG